MRLSAGDLLGIEFLFAGNVDNLKKRILKGVSTDSRYLKSGEIFFALRGEKYDGHEFVLKAFAAGAACAVVDEKADITAFKNHSYIIVNDTTKALGELARIYRKKFDIPVIAVAGSNGKTTTKEMIAQILSKKYTVHSTQGNLNNHIGVPQTIFGLKKSHEIAVIELGTNHFGELEYLCGIAEPTHGLITNIGREHLEFFGDLDGVARAESELWAALGKTGTGFINNDDPYVVATAKNIRRKVRYACSTRSVNLRGKILSIDENGCVTFRATPKRKKPFEVTLSVPGNHVVSNAVAATAVGLYFKVSAKDIQRALGEFEAVSKRMEITKIGGITIINDTYNANPDSVMSALQTLQSMKASGRKIIILSDMLEVGPDTKREHSRIGRTIGEMGFEFLLTYGNAARAIHENADVKMKLHYDQKNILAEYAVELVSAGDIVLVKGSRGMKMEDVVLFLQERLRGKMR